jgi:hypothetical protein
MAARFSGQASFEKHPVFSRLHSGLGHFLRGAHSEDWPDPLKLQRGSVAPFFPPAKMVEVARDFTVRFSKLCPPVAKKEHAAALKLIARFLKAPEDQSLFLPLVHAADALKSDPRSLMAQRATGCARSTLKGKYDIAVRGVNEGFGQVARVLGWDGKSKYSTKAEPARHPAVKGLVLELDEQLMNAEAEWLALERGKTKLKVKRVLARPGKERGKLDACVFETADGEFGAVVKVNNRWTLARGDKETVLATLPEDVFGKVGAALSQA